MFVSDRLNFYTKYAKNQVIFQLNIEEVHTNHIFCCNFNKKYKNIWGDLIQADKLCPENGFETVKNGIRRVLMAVCRMFGQARAFLMLHAKVSLRKIIITKG